MTGRSPPAKEYVVSVCQTITCSVGASHGRATICQNGIDCKPNPLGRTVYVENRRPSPVIGRHSVVDSEPSTADTTPPVIDSKPQFLKLLAPTGLLETSSRQPEALFHRLKALGRQSGALNFEMCGLRSPSRGFRSSAQTVQSMTSLSHSRDLSARFARRTRHRTGRARVPPRRPFCNLGLGFSRPSLEIRSITTGCTTKVQSPEPPSA
jgi:hypothetical protein